jgi:hypothetical protein
MDQVNDRHTAGSAAARSATVADNQSRLKDHIAGLGSGAAAHAVDEEPHGFVGHVDDGVLRPRQARPEAADAGDGVR